MFKTTRITLISAMGRARAIGRGNALPWQLPADLAHFKAATLNKPIVMGRKTFDSIGHPLPKRRNLVVTRQISWAHEGCEVFNTLESALRSAGSDEEVMVIGGASIYEQALPLADTLLLTFIDIDVPDADAFFPAWEACEWKVVCEQPCESDAENPYAYRFVTLKRA